MKTLFCIVILAPALALGQSMIGYGAGVGRAAVAAAGAGAGLKTAGHVIQKSAQQLDKANQKPPAQSETMAEMPKPISEEQPVKNPALDPEAIPIGMDREEFFRQFGKPAAKITLHDSGGVVERCLYKRPGLDPVIVVLRNGKVESVQV